MDASASKSIIKIALIAKAASSIDSQPVNWFENMVLVVPSRLSKVRLNTARMVSQAAFIRFLSKLRSIFMARTGKRVQPT